MAVCMIAAVLCLEKPEKKKEEATVTFPTTSFSFCVASAPIAQSLEHVLKVGHADLSWDIVRRQIHCME